MSFGFHLLRTFFRRIAEGISGPKTLHNTYPEYPIGEGSYGIPQVLRWPGDGCLRIGAYCSIGNNVTIFLGGEHRVDWITTYPFNKFWRAASTIEGHPYSKGDVTIGNDVWIGYGATIMSGVRLGNGAVIGAHALVARDVPPYSIVVGNPARVVRMRFDDTTISRLEQIAWWQWNKEMIEHYLPLLMSDNIQEFLDLAEQELLERQTVR